MKYRKAYLVVAACTLVLAACIDNDHSIIETRQNPSMLASLAEGELMGSIFSPAHNDYYVELAPRFESDDDWVYAPHSWTIWADTARHPTTYGVRNWMYEWSDPRDGGLCGEE